MVGNLNKLMIIYWQHVLCIKKMYKLFFRAGLQ